MTAQSPKLQYERSERGAIGGRARAPAALTFALMLAVTSLAEGGSTGGGRSQEPSGTVPLRHQPAPCMDTETFPLIEVPTRADAAGALRGLSVRFRSEDAPDWHEIALRPESNAQSLAVLPRPRVEAVRVHYYFTWGRPEQRSEEFVVNVLMGGCPGARSAPAELTQNIRVRRTSNTQDELPRGFSPDGIARGPSSRLTLGIVAGGVAGAGVAAIAVAGEDPAPVVPGVDPEAPRACFLPDPVPDINSGGTIRFDASCTTPATVTSFEWNFGDGATGQGSSVEHVFTPGGIYNVTLTVSDAQRTDSISRVVRVLATPTACFVTTPDPPRIAPRESINFNAECSMGDRDGGPSAITRYEWDFGDNRPGTEGVFVSRQFARPDLYGVTLTVTNAEGRRDQTTQFVVVEPPRSIGSTDVSFTSQLELPSSASGQISLNGSETVAAAAPAPQRHRVRAQASDNVVEARLITTASEPGRWQFDFSTTDGFVPGSLRVEAGHVLTLESRRVVFRVSEGTSPPIRFRFLVRVEE